MPLDFSQAYFQGELEKKVRNFEKIRKTTVLLFNADMEPPAVDWICNMVRKRKIKGGVDFFIESAGGDLDSAYHIGKLLQESVKGKLTFIVPRYAKSAATLLCCAGDEIIMTRKAELGPLDPQIRLKGERFSALAVKAALGLINQNYTDKKTSLANKLATLLPSPLMLGELDRSLEISKSYLNKLLMGRMFRNGNNKKKVNDISEKLAKKYTHHLYVINHEEAKNELKLKVRLPSLKENDYIYEIHNLQAKINEIRVIQKKLSEHALMKRIINKMDVNL